jgi:hypothetical protein
MEKQSTSGSTASVPAWGKLLAALACVAIAFSSIALWLAARSPVGQAQPAGSCEDLKARAELAELRANRERTGETRAGEAQARANPDLATNAANGSSSGGPPPAPPRTPLPAGATPMYVKFDVPNKAVSVVQAPNGALAISNTDPSLAGKSITISGVTADGDTEAIQITVPPP